MNELWRESNKTVSKRGKNISYQAHLDKVEALCLRTFCFCSLGAQTPRSKWASKQFHLAMEGRGSASYYPSRSIELKPWPDDGPRNQRYFPEAGTVGTKRDISVAPRGSHTGWRKCRGRQPSKPGEAQQLTRFYGVPSNSAFTHRDAIESKPTLDVRIALFELQELCVRVFFMPNDRSVRLARNTLQSTPPR